MRTQEEIVKKVKETEKEFLSFAPEVLLYYLDYDHAKTCSRFHINPEITQEKWSNNFQVPLVKEKVLAEAEAYMAMYGWNKAEDHRGNSAGRTIDKMETWIWLLGEDDFLKEVKSAPYKYYGAPKLKLICEHFDWPLSDDEGVLRMAEGLPCRDGCDEGCGG
jgi:hypothetical protein